MGFGNVGKALGRLLLQKKDELLTRYKLDYSVTGIATARHGIAIDLAGLDLEEVLRSESLDKFNRETRPVDMLDFIHQCGADILFENTPVNYETGQPAVDHLRTALESGMHAITANKGPVVHAYRSLTDLAASKKRKFLFESAVMDGAPIFSLFREALPGANLLSFRGVLNSTTNMILTCMENGDSFDHAVQYCQEIGIAETDPSGDIDGWDAAVKVAALTTVLIGVPLRPHEVDRQGIRQITDVEIERARSEGKRWKLICSSRRTSSGGVEAIVKPEMVAPTSPLYNVSGTTSSVEFETDVLGLLSIVESNPGPHTTAYGLFADFLNAVK
jgi:homoserine dehydrogenase